MGVKANIALHVDVTGPGIMTVIITSHSSHLLNTPILGSTEEVGGW